MIFLNQTDIENYINYKYDSEDNCFLTKYYRIIWNNISNIIPKYIHPNIITLMGLFIIIFGYYLANVFNNYSNIFMSLAIIGYTLTDGIDGIHARKTNQTSIIGEYMDHLIDLIVYGIISSYILNMLGLNNIYYKNAILLCGEFYFFKTHYLAINNKKIIFSGMSDISTILTLSIIGVFLNIKLSDFAINNIWILVLILGIIIIQDIYKLYILSDNKIYNNFKKVYLCYWIIKFFSIIFCPKKYLYILPIIDLLLLIETINLKIFMRQIFNKYLLFVLLLISIQYRIFTCIFTLLFTLYYLINISKQLNINIIYNPKSKYLKRVYCCGVFDLCHLGHMKLFEKIVNSFDEEIWLIVGVHSDLTVKSYKREPIINEKMRIETVKLCKYVDEVYPNAELIVTKEFCLANKIDCVIIGEEYMNNKDKIWYMGAIELSIHKYISRYEELSTSDIIKKIKLIS